MKIKPILFLFLALVAISACNKKDNFDYPAGTVGSSTIVYFPAIAIKGSRIIAVTQGSTFTDPGATATLNGAAVTYTTTPTVNTATPGIYTLTYTATNTQGYTATDWRMVVVAPTSVASDPVASKNDFSGTYLRAATGVTSTWTKLATGVYTVENAGGAATGAGLLVVATNYTGNVISIPTQNDPYYGGTVSSTGAVYTKSTPAQYSWVFNASGYGTGVRTFVKQ
jgi:hypothetical protein